MSLYEAIANHAIGNSRALRETDRAAYAASLQASRTELAECVLMSGAASKVIAAGGSQSLDEAIDRACYELVLWDAVRDHIERKTGVSLPEDDATCLVLPIAKKLLAGKKDTALDEQLLSRIALEVIAHRARASLNDPLVS